jgi:hypothetical protein
MDSADASCVQMGILGNWNLKVHSLILQLSNKEVKSLKSLG